MSKNLTTATNTLGEPIFIIQIIQGEGDNCTVLPMRQADGTTVEQAKTSARYYVSRGYKIRLLESQDAGKTGRVVDYRF